MVFALYLAMALRLTDIWPVATFERSWLLTVLMLILSAVLGHLVNSYAIKLRSYGAASIFRSAIWAISLALIGFVANIVFGLGAPRTVPLIFGLLAFVLSFSARFGAANLLHWMAASENNPIPVAIYGAGAGGLQLISALRNSVHYRPALLVDDNKSLHGIMFSGLKLHPPSALFSHVNANNVQEVFLAVPSLSASRRQEILSELSELQCPVSELPSYESILQSGGMLSSLRPVEPDELLGRDRVNLDIPELEETYADACVMVSGAGGSIGSELCRKILAVGAKKIVLFERSELALYNIEKELLTSNAAVPHKQTEIVPVLGSINDGNRIRQTLLGHQVNIILHAAAYKHVPLVESNKCEGIRNNVFGTKTLADAAVECGVMRFIMISTDKAVRPTGVMGASKRMAELVVQDIQSRSAACVFGIVRFGNVLGSSGSVIPLFKEQISRGGPVTLTHTQVTRYFMSIKEAAHLVLLAGTFAEGGEVFVLDMGEPVRIEDLARRMIKLSGRTVREQANPDGDISIEVTGLRDGEKLYEELLVGADSLPTPHPKILRASEKTFSDQGIEEALKQLHKRVDENNGEAALKTLTYFVEEFGQNQ